MYIPPSFSVDSEAAWDVVRDAGAGVLVGTTAHGLASVVVPVSVSDDRTTLRAHVARANPWWREVPEGTEVLGIFLAASAYVSPSLYPSLATSPGAVPTWNYAVAEVRGALRVIEDPVWLEAQVRALTAHFEEPRDPRWLVDDTPEGYLDSMLRGIVGIEIAVASIEAKEKLSQNRPEIDRAAVRDNFAHGSARETIVAARMR